MSGVQDVIESDSLYVAYIKAANLVQIGFSVHC